MRCGEMNLGGWWPRVSSVAAGADIRQSHSARSCISPQSSFHSRWCMSCICGNHLGKSRVFFLFFFPSQQLFIEFPIQSSTVNLGMKHLKGSEIYIYLHLSKKSQSGLQKWSGVKGSACLINALFPISLCTWGIGQAFPTVHCRAQLQADGTLRVYICLLHPIWPSLLFVPLIVPLLLGQHESVLWDLNKRAGLAFCSLFLTKILMHLHTTHQPLCPVCASLAWVLCYISSTSPQMAVLLVNSSCHGDTVIKLLQLVFSGAVVLDFALLKHQNICSFVTRKHWNVSFIVKWTFHIWFNKRLINICW